MGFAETFKALSDCKAGNSNAFKEKAFVGGGNWESF